MNITLLATVCHLLAGTATACTEEHVLSTYENPSLTPMACQMFGQAIIAQWKNASRFADEEFTVQGYRCAPGNEQPKGRV